MKKLFLIVAFATLTITAFGQGRSISRRPKISTPYVTEDGETLKIGTTLQLLEPTGAGNSYKYVQLLNKFNEPIQPATSRASMKKQPILFFKTEDDVMYAFTEFFCINIEAALYSKEMRIIKAKPAPAEQDL